MSTRVVIVAMLAMSSIAHAQSDADVTVDQAIGLFRERSPRLAATRAEVDVVGADIVEADIYPNPEVGISTSRTAAGDTAGPNGQYVLDLSVPVLIGHQRAHRMTAAKAHVAAARAEVGVAQGEAELEVRRRFAALFAAQEQTAVLEAALADARNLREIVAGRTIAGAGSPYAVERIDLAIAALASRADAAKADEASASGELATAVGIAGWHPHAIGDLAAAVGVSSNAIDPGHPALAFDRANQEAARADVARAKADGVPTPSLGVQTFATTAPNGAALTFGVSVPLPVFDRNQGAVARARAEHHRADLELAARTSELAAELDRALRVVAARKEGLARFQTDGLQRLSKVRTMAETAYRSGQGGIVELLDALDAITDARLREIELRSAVVEAELDVRRAASGR